MTREYTLNGDDTIARHAKCSETIPNPILLAAEDVCQAYTRIFRIEKLIIWEGCSLQNVDTSRRF